MKNKKTIYLHIGTPKAGSSSIQNTLFNNIENLKRQGYLYPKTGLKLANHYFLADSIINPTINSEEIYTQLLKEFEESKSNNLIISTERFHILETPEQIKILKNLLEGYNIKIIIYLRRQDLFIQSAYGQQIRGQLSITIQDFLKKKIPATKLLDYYSRLEMWSNVFGKENITVQPFERKQLGNGLINNFFSFLEITDTQNFNLTEYEKVNMGLNSYETELLRVLNKHNLQPAIIQKLKDYIISNSSHKTSDLLSYKEKTALLRKYKACNQKIAEEYLKREAGNLFYDFPSKKDSYTKIKKTTLIKYFDESSDKILNENEKQELRNVKLYILRQTTYEETFKEKCKYFFAKF